MIRGRGLRGSIEPSELENKKEANIPLYILHFEPLNCIFCTTNSKLNLVKKKTQN